MDDTVLYMLTAVIIITIKQQNFSFMEKKISYNFQKYFDFFAIQKKDEIFKFTIYNFTIFPKNVQCLIINKK